MTQLPNNTEFPAKWWHRMETGRIQCDLCPRLCRLNDGQKGHCFVRQRKADQIVLTTYGRASGFVIDPIEKKPLNHFFPGTPVLSFGTAGCNLACKFCQNWNISKSREFDTLSRLAEPEQIAHVAKELGCKSVAFTYNDPVIFAEYAIDVALACHEMGLKTVAVTAGYIEPEPRKAFFEVMDAVNVDLKAFTEEFYVNTTASHLMPVLETLKHLNTQPHIWYEITTLLIPGYNDSDKELHALTEWVASNLGLNVPIHFSAFHPDFKMTDTVKTPLTTLQRASGIAKQTGLRYVYTGNVHDPKGDQTLCPGCNNVVIQRDWYDIGEYNLSENGYCLECDFKIAGHFSKFNKSFGRQRIVADHYFDKA